MTKRKGLVALWGLILLAELAIYSVQFPRLVEDISRTPSVFSESMGATGMAVFASIVGITVWVFVLVIPLGNRPKWLWLRMAQTVFFALFSLGVCIAVLIK